MKVYSSFVVQRLLYMPLCQIFFFLIYFWLCWAFVSVRGLSLVAASGGPSSSQCAGLSLSRPLLLWSTGSRCAGSVIVAHGPSCSAACGIFPDQGSNPCPLHWKADSQPLRHQGSPIVSNWSEVLSWSSITLLILCLFMLLVNKRGMFGSSSIKCDSLTLQFCQFFFVYFETLMLTAYTFKIVMLCWRSDPLSPVRKWTKTRTTFF